MRPPPVPGGGLRLPAGLPSAPGVGARQGHLPENGGSAERVPDVSAGRMIAQPERSPECSQREAVVMRSGRRARAAPAGIAEVIAALLWRRGAPRHAFRQISAAT